MFQTVNLFNLELRIGARLILEFIFFASYITVSTIRASELYCT